MLAAMLAPSGQYTRLSIAALTMLGVPWTHATLLTLTEHRGDRVEAY